MIDLEQKVVRSTSGAVLAEFTLAGGKVIPVWHSNRFQSLCEGGRLMVASGAIRPADGQRFWDSIGDALSTSQTMTVEETSTAGRGTREAAPTVVRLDAGESERVRQLIAQAAERMRLAIKPAAVEDMARKFAAQVSTQQRMQLGAQVHAALGADVVQDGRGIQEQIDNFVHQNVSLITTIPQRLLADVEGLVQDSVTGGDLSVDLADQIGDLENDIGDRVDISERHARFIARDQAGKLYGQINQARQQSLGVSKFVWRTSEDERVRGDPTGKYPKALPSHFDLDGETFEWDDPPQPEGADEPLIPGQDYGCLPGGARVFSQAAVQVVYRRRYTGEGTILKTDNGRVLTTTMNHPVLTGRGWIPAHLVEVGDDLVQIPSERVDVSVPDDEDRYPMIQEVFGALAPLGHLELSGGPGRWFHGDGSDEEIDVVDVDRCLRLERDPELRQAFCQELLALADQSSLATGRLDSLFDRVDTSSVRFVRGGSKLLTALLISGRHSGEHGAGAIAWLDATADKLSSNGLAVDVEVLREALHTPPVGVELQHHVARVVAGIVRRAVDGAARLNAPDAQLLAEIVARDIQDLGSLGDGVPGQKFCRVVEKLRCEYASRHVYNFQTKTGWYTSQGLVVQNCRCTAEPDLDDLLSDEDQDAEGDQDASEPDDSEE